MNRSEYEAKQREIIELWIRHKKVLNRIFELVTEGALEMPSDEMFQDLNAITTQIFRAAEEYGLRENHND